MYIPLLMHNIQTKKKEMFHIIVRIFCVDKVVPIHPKHFSLPVLSLHLYFPSKMRYFSVHCSTRIISMSEIQGQLKGNKQIENKNKCFKRKTIVQILQNSDNPLSLMMRIFFCFVVLCYKTNVLLLFFCKRMEKGVRCGCRYNNKK